MSMGGSPVTNMVPVINDPNNFIYTTDELNKEFCIPVLAVDPPSSDGSTTPITISENVDFATLKGTSICFTPTRIGMVSIPVTVKDDFCPTPGQGTFTYVINVIAASQARTPIPTMSQWGLLIFGLLVLNLSVLFINRKEVDLG